MLHRSWIALFTLSAGVAFGSGAVASELESGWKSSLTAPAADVLIPRATFFGNPDRAAAQISPDGTQLAYLAPVNGVLNIWVAPIDRPQDARAVTDDTGRGIRRYFWAFNGTHLVYLQDQGGDENWKVYSVNLTTNQTRDLTPFESIEGPDGKPIMLPSGKPLRPTARIEGLSDRLPNELLVGLNNRNPQFHDIHRLNLLTGSLELVLQNDEYTGFMIDDDFNIRLALRQTPDGGQEILKAEGGGFVHFQKIGHEDALTTQPTGFDKTGGVVFMTESRGRDTAALTAVNLSDGTSRLIAEDARADTSGVLVHPTERTVQAVNFNYDRNNWKIIDPAIKPDLEYLAKVNPGEIGVASRSLDDKHWIVAYTQDTGPLKYYHYDRSAGPGKGKATFLFTNRSSLEGLPLARMHPVTIKSRDGLNLVSYLTLPNWTDTDGDGRPNTALPMVLLVHGGPWARDSWGFNGYHQWLANRGYAVLSVNFRGSTGFGKNFLNAGNREWAGKMHDDLIDAVNWAVKQGIAEKDKVAIMGGSYGGYATLVGLTFTPDVFACGVDIVGPSNIVTLLNTIPPHWAPIVELFTVRVGDFRTEEGKKFLESRSPLNFIDRIKRPLLIGQGANDPRVKQSESDQIVTAMQAKNIPVTYVLFPDEGHGFARPENSRSFNAVTEAFLAEHIGGRLEPIGSEFEGSSIQVPAGKEGVPGLAEALGR